MSGRGAACALVVRMHSPRPKGGCIVAAENKGLYMTPDRRRLLRYPQVYAPSESTRQTHKRSAEEYYGNRLLRRSFFFFSRHTH